MSSIPLIAIGSLVLFFGFFGYVVPVGEFGSVIDLSTLCNSLVGQVGRVFNEDALESCQFVNTMAKLVYGLLGIGFILVIVGAIVNPTKKSMYICGYCNTSWGF